MRTRVTAAAAAALLLLAGVAPQPGAAADQGLTARGNEPSWRFTMSGGGVSFEAPGLGLKFESASHSREQVDGRPRILARSGAETLEATVIERLCADTMTGMPFPVGVEVSYGGRRFEGCGGEIMTAIEGGWRVISLRDALLPEGVTATISFGADGLVSGRTGCNRFSGPYSLSGEGLSFGKLAVTRMACPPPEMETEQRFLDLLQAVTRATPGENGRLRLMAGDEQAMVIDRAD